MRADIGHGALLLLLACVVNNLAAQLVTRAAEAAVEEREARIKGKQVEPEFRQGCGKICMHALLCEGETSAHKRTLCLVKLSREQIRKTSHAHKDGGGSIAMQLGQALLSGIEEQVTALVSPSPRAGSSSSSARARQGTFREDALFTVTATADFGADKAQDGELVFGAGDRICVVEADEGEDWWIGFLQGGGAENSKRGLFPRNFAERAALHVRESSVHAGDYALDAHSGSVEVELTPRDRSISSEPSTSSRLGSLELPDVPTEVPGRSRADEVRLAELNERQPERTSSGRELPEGWTEVPYPGGHQDTYFWNTLTGETAWQFPLDRGDDDESGGGSRRGFDAAGEPSRIEEMSRDSFAEEDD